RGGEDLFFVPEMRVERARSRRKARGVLQVGDGGAAVAALGEQAQGLRNDAIACAHRRFSNQGVGKPKYSLGGDSRQARAHLAFRGSRPSRCPRSVANSAVSGG